MKITLLQNFIVRLKLFINIALGRTSYFYKGLKKYDLIIYDDVFPHPITGFRLEEFKTLLGEFENAKMLLIPDSYPALKTSKEFHPIHIKEFEEKHLKLKSKLKILKGFVNVNTKLFYCVFITNIFSFLDILEKNKIPFIFTLYPGGGFKMNDKVGDAKLRKVLSSKMFRKVIVTQKITKDYLVANNFCKEEDIEFIFGCVVPQESLIKNLSGKKYYPFNKKQLDICFCAAKYMPKGIDKGYDVFIELAHSLRSKYDFINFHVIGGFDENDIDVSAISNSISFYGYQNFENLRNIFRDVDVLISPNKPFILGNGAFDGFPLGTVVEAALNGVLVILSDNLEQNTTFVNQQEVIIVESDSEKIEEEIIKLIKDPSLIEKIAHCGQLKFQQTYSNEVQMNPRIDILKKHINNE